MPRNALAPILLGGAVVVALALGLWQTGGPSTGKMERRDQTRLDDLRQLSQNVHCRARNEGGTLPETLDAPSPCTPPARLADPYTDAPYRYEKLSDITFTLCADFERPDRIGRPYGFDPGTGCLQLPSK